MDGELDKLSGSIKYLRIILPLPPFFFLLLILLPHWMTGRREGGRDGWTGGGLGRGRHHDCRRGFADVTARSIITNIENGKDVGLAQHTLAGSIGLLEPPSDSEDYD